MNTVKNFIIKNRQRLIIAASAVLLLIGFINLYYILEVNVTSNDECLWVPDKVTKDSSAIHFQLVKVGGVAWNAGIRDGDQLLEINHIKLKNTFQAQQILNQFEEGDFAPYTYEHKGTVHHTKVYIKKLIQFPFLGMNLLAIIWLIIGFIVVMAKPDGTIQRHFYRLGVLFILLLTISILNGSGQNLSIPLALLLDITWSLAACYLPFMLMHFFWIFPKPFSFMNWNWFRKALFIIPGLMFLASFVYRIFYVYAKPNSQIFYQSFTTNLNIFLFVSVAVSLGSLIISYKKLDKADRRPLFVILASYLLGYASILYVIFVAPAITDTLFNQPEFYMPIILVAIIPISFAYSIFRYQLMDVSVVVKNTILYGAATIFVAAIYFLVIYLLGQTISSAIGTEYQGIIAGVIFISFALVFQSTKDKFQDFITEKFYPEQFAYQKVLISFINDISTYVGLETILDSMKKTFVHALRLGQFAILLKDDKNGVFHQVRSEGISNSKLNVLSELLQSFIESKQKLEKIPVIEREEFGEVFPAHKEVLEQENIYTIIPMMVKSKIVGLLLFGLKHSGSQFGGKDLELLYAAASQAAVSIENARLYKSESEKLKIEQDLDLARKIQQGLLPKCIPSMEGLDICGQMISAMQVGGDYFDLLPVTDDKIFVVVGDVSGKGLSASLYMTKLQTMIQLACTADKSPKEILVEVNKRLYEAIGRNWFVTMTLALFDTKKRTVKFCRAGHMPVLISNNGGIELYRTQGIGIGLERGIIFEKTLFEEEIKLKHGQIYAFFSDGITEAMNENQDLYGEEQLAVILKNKSSYRSSEIMNEVWDDITAYRGTAEQNDDMTMVIVKVSN